MPYGKNELKQSNINYIGRDFNDLKKSLMNYAETYFPNSYKDFNETSPGMMLLEMSAYVGDVLNFYVDQQYREMMLPLSEERKNVVQLAKSYGYKIKPISPAYVDLTMKCTIGAKADGSPDYSTAITIDKGLRTSATTNPEIVFETLDVVDFSTSSSADLEPEVTEMNNETGVPTGYTLTRKVKAVSGQTKTTTFDITNPEKFKKISLVELNVIEILKVTDTNGNVWSEVQNLAQDKVPVHRHYSSDDNRSSAYHTSDGTVIGLPVPYSLEYNKVNKKFVVDVDENNVTSLTFGNGVLKNGSTFNSTFLAVEQIGINLPGAEESLESEIEPLLGDAYGTLGEAPAHTTLTVTYRVGGGTESNLSSGELALIQSATTIPSGLSTSNITLINENPASGGGTGETIEEIRYRTMGHISTQNRCVTKEDYEARTLNMPAKFGNIAKIYASRGGAVRNAERQRLTDMVNRLKDVIDLNYQLFEPNIDAGQRYGLLETIKSKLDADRSGGLTPDDFNILYQALELAYNNVTQDDRLATIDLYMLSYNNNKQLTNTPNIIKQNLKQYLNEYRLLTDQVTFYSGYIINFGVVFDVVAMPYENKEEVKLRCIDAIKNYFEIDKMQFKQILYTQDIDKLLSDVDGVRIVNYITITQDIDYNSSNAGGTQTSVFSPGLFTTLINDDGTTSTVENQDGYGYYYDFGKFFGNNAVAGKGVILPAYEPSVFELKDPNNNIKGIVR